MGPVQARRISSSTELGLATSTFYSVRKRFVDHCKAETKSLLSQAPVCSVGIDNLVRHWKRNNRPNSATSTPYPVVDTTVVGAIRNTVVSTDPVPVQRALVSNSVFSRGASDQTCSQLVKNEQESFLEEAQTALRTAPFCNLASVVDSGTRRSNFLPLTLTPFSPATLEGQLRTVAKVYQKYTTDSGTFYIIFRIR